MLVALVALGSLGCTTTVTRPFDFAAQRPARAAAGCPDDVTDVEGHVYPTVLIGEQCWTAANLKTAHYRDGSDVEDTVVIDLEAYGRLYRFAQVASDKGLCPAGWHVPSDEEVQTLERAVGLPEAALQGTGWRGETDPARTLKLSDSAFSWTAEEEAEVNRTGFSFPAAGESIGLFTGASGLYAGLWTSTRADDDTAWVRYFVWLAVNPRSGRIWRDHVDDERAYSVRCLHDGSSLGAPGG